ncbi:BGTF surface domain-containing protein [Halococcus sp. IIIV-5B]|uniref:DUF7282 domain-containing protein n=1 Tax=Halococcus sp. IIIV-5B TaxID=2321230 RepID=UPI001F42B220|nr:BGTF surface domain-containing protein [Halococcus sp. IIIV-5B]
MTSPRRRRIGVALVALVVLATVAGVMALPTSAQDAGNATETATFNRSTVAEHRGDIAAIPVTLAGTTSATVTVGSGAVNYATNVTVNDTDGDGQVTLRMNTYLAGTGENESEVYRAGNDTVTETNRTTEPLDAPLEVSTYNLSVAVDGRETDTASLELMGRTDGDLATWTAPAASFDNVTTARDVATAVNAGRITTTDSVANGDVAVNQFRVSGVYGVLAASNFSTLVETGTLDFSMVQTNPETNRPPKRLDLARSLENDSIRVIPDGGNDVLYVNVNTTTAVFENGSLAAGDEFETALTLNGSEGFAGDDRTVSANVTVVGAELGLGALSLSADTNQTVRGTTSVAPGSEVTVRLQRNASDSFVKTNTTRVKPNGSFAATFNLSQVGARTPVMVEATGPLNTSDSTSTIVRARQSTDTAGGTAAVSLADQTTGGETIRLDSVTLPAGGFVVVNASNGTTERLVGVSSYLENGTSRNVTVQLDRPLDDDARVRAVVHTDSNENQVYDFASANGTQDRPYTVDGTPVAASARATVVETTQRPDTGANASTAPNATGTLVATTAGGDTAGTTMGAGTTDETGPGLGPVVAVLAVLVAGLVAWRVR